MAAKNTQSRKNRQSYEDTVIDSIMIAAPCKARWEDMRGNDRVRLCGSCNKNVYNTSQMSEDEIEQLLALEGPVPCLRLYRRADGTLITQDCPSGLKLIRSSWNSLSKVVASILLAMFGAPAVNAQQAVPIERDTVVSPVDLQTEVEGPVGHELSPAMRLTMPRVKRSSLSNDKADFSALTEYKLALSAAAENQAAKADNHFRGAIASLDKAKHDIKFEREVFSAYAKFLDSRHRDATAKMIRHKLELREKAAGVFVESIMPSGVVVGGVPLFRGASTGKIPMPGAQCGVRVPISKAPVKQRSTTQDSAINK